MQPFIDVGNHKIDEQGEKVGDQPDGSLTKGQGEQDQQNLFTAFGSIYSGHEVEVLATGQAKTEIGEDDRQIVPTSPDDVPAWTAVTLLAGCALERVEDSGQRIVRQRCCNGVNGAKRHVWMAAHFIEPLKGLSGALVGHVFCRTLERNLDDQFGQSAAGSIGNVRPVFGGLIPGVAQNPNGLLEGYDLPDLDGGLSQASNREGCEIGTR